jgi:hypothetical protein
MEGLTERMARAGAREMRNRFVVAGVRMAIRMARDREREAGGEGRLVARLEAEEKVFQARIAQ